MTEYDWHRENYPVCGLCLPPWIISGGMQYTKNFDSRDWSAIMCTATWDECTDWRKCQRKRGYYLSTRLIVAVLGCTKKEANSLFQHFSRHRMLDDHGTLVPHNGARYGWVYAITGANAVKVGFTTQDPAHRLNQLQTGSAEKLNLVGQLFGTESLEKSLHNCMSQHGLHVRGEWFLDGKWLDAFVNADCDHETCYDALPDIGEALDKHHPIAEVPA